MCIKQMNKKVTIKNHPNPKFKITDKLKVEYVQIAYDNRYIIVKQSDYGTNWSQIVKVEDSYIAKILIEALIKDIKDDKKQKRIFDKLTNFWTDIDKYNEVLDLDE